MEMSQQNKVEAAQVQSVLRWTAPCGLVGAALAIFGNIAHPTMPTDGRAALLIVCGHSAWTWIHFAVIVAAVLTLLGLRGFVALVRDAVPARLGYTVAMVGAAVLIVAFGIDGFTTKAVSDSWAVADPADKPTLLLIGHSIELLHTGLFYLWLPLFLGAPPLLLGFAFWGEGRGRILGIWGIATGLACLGIGTWGFLTRQFSVDLPSLVAAFSSVLWYLAGNIVAARRAFLPGPRAL